MKNLLTTVIILVSAAPCMAELEARAVHQFWFPTPANEGTSGASSNGDLFKNLVVWLYLTNRGPEDVRIPTEGFGGGEGDDDVRGNHLIKVSFSHMENPLNIVPVLPASRLGIVQLKTNETAIIRYEAAVYPPSIAQLRIVYEVPADFAKKYGLWCGKLQVLSKEASRAPGK